MSDWLHVAAIARIDDIRFNDAVFDAEAYFGKSCLWNDDEEVWDDVTVNPENYLPMGSEGSLQLYQWVNPDPSAMAAYDIMIFGDLRDVDDIDLIIEWFKDKLNNKELMVRQACITVNSNTDYKTWTYEFEEE